MQPKFIKPINHKNQLMKSALDHYYKTKEQAKNFKMNDMQDLKAINKKNFASRIKRI